MHLEVSDTGVGISEDDLQFIFDEFVQVGADLNKKQRGAGLGLSIVKKLVHLQDGEINVESTPGKGTRFILKIPYKSGDPKNIRYIKPELIHVPSWFRSLHFLIVDDEEFNLYLIKGILNKWGVSFTEAFNGKEAVELVKENAYDLILIDIQMPIMDGYEAAKQILQHRPSSKIIALTATTQNQLTFIKWSLQEFMLFYKNLLLNLIYSLIS